MSSRRSLTKKDQSGFAALIVAMIIVLVLSLLTVGFATLMQHEQRSALDKQLSSQAYYAAETGVNDAIQALNDGLKVNKTTCNNPGSFLGTLPLAVRKDLKDYSVGGTALNTPGATNASYTCLLIDESPPSIHYNPITINQQKIIEVEGLDRTTGAPTAVSSIGISWQDSGNSNNFVTPTATGQCNSGNLPPAGNPTPPNWGNTTGILRVELMPIDQLTREHLIKGSYIGFLCPVQDGARNWGGTSFNNGYNNGAPGLYNSADMVTGSCNSSIASTSTPTLQPENCNVYINAIDTISGPAAAFFINLQSLYNATSVTITLYDNSDSSGKPSIANQLNIYGAQTIIDSTGKAQDVLRRIQVGVPSRTGFYIPAGTHGNICKQLNLVPPTAPIPSSTGTDPNSSCASIQP